MRCDVDRLQRTLCSAIASIAAAFVHNLPVAINAHIRAQSSSIVLAFCLPIDRGKESMKSTTLVTKRLYFGVDAIRLREATGRILLRVVGLPPERATVSLDTLVHDFGLLASAGRAMAEQMVRSGLLERLSPTGTEFGITDKFRQYAQARIVEPLPRTRAQLLVTQVAQLADDFNRTATRNKYELEAVAVYGDYMSLDPWLEGLSIGVTGRRRAPSERPAMGRATKPVEGHEQIRAILEKPSSFVHVGFFHHVQDIPRPFSVIYKAEG
jgi:hypothetical protein